MFKKITSVILSLTLILSFAGCSQNNIEATNDPSGSTNQTTSAPETKVTEATEVNYNVETDEKFLTVDITFPSSFFQGEDMDTFDADAYANENGFNAAVLNEDGSLTVTMTKSKHRELLEEMSISLDENFAELIEGEDTPYIKDITHNEDFTVVTMKVDRATYENAFDMTPLAIGMSTAMYQMLIEIENYVAINIVDVATGETINTITYPDTLEG